MNNKKKKHVKLADKTLILTNTNNFKKLVTKKIKTKKQKHNPTATHNFYVT